MHIQHTPEHDNQQDVPPPEHLEDAESTDVALRRSRITWASDIEPEPVVWAWTDDGQGRIPSGSLSIAAGREGTGKSSFGIWLAAQISNGQLSGNLHGTRHTVLYVAVEDSWKYTLAPRLIAAGADLSKIGRFDVINMHDEEITLSLPHDNNLLESAIREHGTGLVVIDPLMSVIGERIDTHREREVRSALDPLARLADRTGAVLLGVAHFNKGAGTDAASLITGSGAFKNVPRTVFGFARDETDDSGQRVMTQVKNSLGRDDLPSLGYRIESAEVDTRKGVAVTGRFMFTGTSERSVHDVLRDARRDPEDLAAGRDAASFIEEYLGGCGGESDPADVIKAGKGAGYAESTLKNARHKVADYRRQGFGKDQRTTWILRTGTTTDTADTTDQKVVPAVSVTVSADPAREGGGLYTPVTSVTSVTSHQEHNTRNTSNTGPGDADDDIDLFTAGDVIKESLLDDDGVPDPSKISAVADAIPEHDESPNTGGRHA